MNLEDVRYDAFISYRHCERDMFVAKEIHKLLENFKLPKSIRKLRPELPAKIERVFRDQEELPLTSNLADPITVALENSKCLIVICTPRLRESLWCKQEIDTFIKMHGRENVFAVLAEGEPDESFPEQLLYDENGKPMEPLGADARGESEADVRKKLKTEVLRLLAPMYKLNYDDLRQRHREQRMKRLMTLGGVAMAGVLGFGIYMGITAMTIRKQADEIELQNAALVDKNAQIEAQNEEIIARNEEIKAKSYEIAGRLQESMVVQSKKLLSEGRLLDALYAMRSAMPETKDSEEIPYLAAAERQLAATLGVYTIGEEFLPVDIYRDMGRVTSMAVSPEGTYLAIIDEEDCLHLFDAKEHIELMSVQCRLYVDDRALCFLTDDLMAYAGEETYNLYRISDGTTHEIGNYEGRIALSPDGSKFAAELYNTVVMYSMDTLEPLWEIPMKNGEMEMTLMYSGISETGSVYAQLVFDRHLYDYWTPIEVHVYDAETGQRLYIKKFDGLLQGTDISVYDDVIYVGINRSNDEFANASANLKSYSSIYALDTGTGNVKWSKMLGNESIKDITRVEVAGEQYLYAWDVNGPYLLSVQDGRIIYAEGGVGAIKCSYHLSAGELLILMDGRMMVFHYETGRFYDYDAYVAEPSLMLQTMAHTKGGYYMHFLNTDYVTKYAAPTSPRLESLPELPAPGSYQALELSTSDEKLAFDLPDGRKLTYDFDDFAVLRNADGEIVADLTYGKGLLDDGRLLFISRGNSSAFAIQPYTYEELIALADEMLEGYVPAEEF